MKRFFLYLMSLLYVLAGINHFRRPVIYRQIMPLWLPRHELLVHVSGICEIVLGLLLLFPRIRRIAAWGIILLLIAVFPANIQMFLDYRQVHHPYLWAAALRLPLQGLLIWWAWVYASQKSKVKSQKATSL